MPVALVELLDQVTDELLVAAGVDRQGVALGAGTGIVAAAPGGDQCGEREEREEEALHVRGPFS